VLLETGGQCSLEEVDSRVHKIMDFKCPSSGMEAHNLYDNLRFLTPRDEAKFVIGDRADFNWACEIIRRFNLTARVSSVLVSPVFSKVPNTELAEWVLKCGLPVRLQVQLHKIIWPEAQRGV
jgi:7-carboxy-7-deazaguanine synthase